ncbi:MAG: hypothetical protein KAS16_09210 [Thermoplasmata archaeon]|nr:hypothetical protein [Thermoplasmata archaeon]
MPKKKEEEIEPVTLTVGSQYRIKSLESRDAPLISHGKFLGYTSIGSDEGLCIELDESYKDMSGRVRVIPMHMIVCIDIITAKEKKEDKKKPSSNMFG